MPNFGKRLCAPAALITACLPVPTFAQAIMALPDQTSSIRLSNRDINHLVCQGGEIEDVKFSAKKAIAVEKAGATSDPEAPLPCAREGHSWTPSGAQFAGPVP